MKKYLIIVPACLCAAPAVAGTVNFISDCDSCVQFVSCMTKKIIPTLNCDIVSNSGTYEEWAPTYDVTAAANACAAAHPAFYHKEEYKAFTKNLAFAYVADTCFMSEQDLVLTSMAAAEAVMFECLSIGYCLCKDGDYIQPRGLEPGMWAVNSECKKCPEGGTADGGFGLTVASCYIPAGAFSDETGSGVYSDNCPASYGSEQDKIDAYK